jgi:hypothetical protein
MRTALLGTLILLGMTISHRARDCTVSKEFEIKHSQLLSGVLQDPAGASIPRLMLWLLSGNDIVRSLRTDNHGAYDFGEVPTGKYRISVPHNGFCAPEVKCGTKGCSFTPRLRIDPMSGTGIVWNEGMPASNRD